jgi:hypothetical protein
MLPGILWYIIYRYLHRWLDTFTPSVDVSDIPKLTARIYQTDDERKGAK